MEHPVVVITGGANGIGRCLCETYLAEGYDVAVLDQDEEACAELSALFSDKRGLYVASGDVSLESVDQPFVDEVIHRFGRLDILIHNAGIGHNASIFERPIEAFDRVMAVNVRGAYLMSALCAPYLAMADPGHIILMASTRALMSEPNTEPYSASKGAILALTHSLAVSLGPRVLVNAISPGWIEVSDWQKESRRKTPVHREIDRLQHPAGRVGTPQDIARACLFLTASQNSFITGTNLVVDGGMTVKMMYAPDGED